MKQSANSMCSGRPEKKTFCWWSLMIQGRGRSRVFGIVCESVALFVHHLQCSHTLRMPFLLCVSLLLFGLIGNRHWRTLCFRFFIWHGICGIILHDTQRTEYYSVVYIEISPYHQAIRPKCSKNSVFDTKSQIHKSHGLFMPFSR